jgi:hypothetical protein
MRKADREREARERREKAAASLRPSDKAAAPAAGGPKPQATDSAPAKQELSKTSALKGGARRELVFDTVKAPAAVLRYDQLPSVITWLGRKPFPAAAAAAAAVAAGNNSGVLLPPTALLDEESMALLEVEAERLHEPPCSDSRQQLLAVSDAGSIAGSDGKVLIKGVWHKTDKAKVLLSDEERQRQELLDAHVATLQKAKANHEYDCLKADRK